MMEIDTSEWSSLSAEEKKRKLFEKQKATLEKFFKCGAISKEQYEKSLGDMSKKMGFDA